MSLNETWDTGRKAWVALVKRGAFDAFAPIQRAFTIWKSGTEFGWKEKKNEERTVKSGVHPVQVEDVGIAAAAAQS